MQAMPILGGGTFQPPQSQDEPYDLSKKGVIRNHRKAGFRVVIRNSQAEVPRIEWLERSISDLQRPVYGQGEEKSNCLRCSRKKTSGLSYIKVSEMLAVKILQWRKKLELGCEYGCHLGFLWRLKPLREKNI